MSRPANQAWRFHPGRICAGNEGYADLLLIKPQKGKTKRQQREEMANACYGCPVFNSCLRDFKADDLSVTDHYGIRAGIIGKA